MELFPCFSRGSYFFFLRLLSKIVLFGFFCSWNMICLVVVFWYLSLVFSKLPRHVVLYLLLILNNAQLFLLYLFILSTLSLPVVCHFQIHLCYTFWNCSTVLGYSKVFFLHSFSLCILVLEDFIDLSSTISYVIQVQATDEPTKVYFIPVTVSLSFRIYFWIFLWIS